MMMMIIMIIMTIMKMLHSSGVLHEEYPIEKKTMMKTWKKKCTSV